MRWSILVVFLALPTLAHAQRFPGGATVSTAALFPWPTEGLTGDGNGHLYTAGRSVIVGGAPAPCPVYRLDLATGATAVVGNIPPAATNVACSTSGLAFDSAGKLYVGESAAIAGVETGLVFRLTPDADDPPTASPYATDVPGANGIAFDRDGNLWVTDGKTGQGRVWRIPPGGGSGSERFRIPPLLNSLGIGRQIKTTPPGVNAVSLGDLIVANGIAFTHSGDAVVADSARGAIWKVELDRDGELLSPTGCDSTFTAPDTLCLSNVLVAHPYLESVDGIALDAAGNIWGVSNARQAVLVVDGSRNVYEIFRNPVRAGRLRNQGPLEFPASPYLLGDRFCTSSFDSTGARDNAPPSAGEIAPGTAAQGKISCIDEGLSIPGLPLPI